MNASGALLLLLLLLLTTHYYYYYHHYHYYYYHYHYYYYYYYCGQGGKYDNGERFDLRLPYADQGWVGEGDEEVAGQNIHLLQPWQRIG